MTNPTRYTADDVPDGNARSVLDWVRKQDDQPAAARVALDKERDGQQRSTLIEALEPIAAADSDDSAAMAADDESVTTMVSSGPSPTDTSAAASPGVGDDPLNEWNPETHGPKPSMPGGTSV